MLLPLIFVCVKLGSRNWSMLPCRIIICIVTSSHKELSCFFFFLFFFLYRVKCGVSKTRHAPRGKNVAAFLLRPTRVGRSKAHREAVSLRKAKPPWRLAEFQGRNAAHICSCACDPFSSGAALVYGLRFTPLDLDNYFTDVNRSLTPIRTTTVSLAGYYSEDIPSIGNKNRSFHLSPGVCDLSTCLFVCSPRHPFDCVQTQIIVYFKQSLM